MTSPIPATSSPAAAPEPMPPAPPGAVDNMHAYWTSFRAPDPTPADRPGPEGLVWWLSGIPDPNLNGVLRARLGESDVAGAVAELRRRLTDAGLPLAWWVGTDSSPADLAERLTALGLPRVGTAVLMSRQLADLPEEQPPPDLTVGVVSDPADLPAWSAVVATAFHLAPAGVAAYQRFETDRPADDGYVRLGGWVDGRLVATSALLVEAGVAGVYTVATLPEHARRGYGRALTLAALAEGRRRGLGVGALQATEDGYPVYRRLGFVDHDTYGIHLLLPQESNT